MDDEQLAESDTGESNGFLSNPFVIFFLGPLIFLLVVRFTGYQIFYHGNPDGKERKRSVWLLSLGALFYVLVVVALSLMTD